LILAQVRWIFPGKQGGFPGKITPTSAGGILYLPCFFFGESQPFVSSHFHHKYEKSVKDFWIH